MSTTKSESEYKSLTYLVVKLIEGEEIYVEPDQFNSLEARYSQFLLDGRNALIEMTLITGQVYHLPLSIIRGFAVTTPAQRRLSLLFSLAEEMEYDEVREEAKQLFGWGKD